MEDIQIAFLIGLMAGSIFFIDGWGPTEKVSSGAEGEKNEKSTLFSSRRFRGLSVLIAGGIITPILDYVTKNTKPEFFMAYLRGCIYGWFFVLLFGLLLYLFWIITRQMDKEKNWYKAGEFAYSILDFIYLGISDNPHLTAKRNSDVKLAQDIYKLESDHEYKRKEKQLSELEKQISAADVRPNEINESTKKLFHEYDDKLKNLKTEADYTFNDWYYKGIAEYDKKEYEKCIAYLKNALALDKSEANIPDALLYIGISYDSLGLSGKAIEQYDKIISDYPGYSKMYIVYYDKGVALANLNLLKEANTAYDKANELMPTYANAWYNKGINLGKMNLYEDAVKAFREALRINPADFEANYNIGYNLAKLEKYEEALTCYQDVVAMKPDFTNAWNSMGISLHKLGRDTEALEAYDKAIALNPTDSNLWSNKAVSLSKLGRKEESFKALEEALRINPNDVDALYNMAGAYAHKNDKASMLANLKKAIEIDPANKIAAQKDNDFKAYWNDPDFQKLTA